MKLQEKYLLIDYEEMLFEELILLRQGQSSVDEYTSRFHELNICSRVFETEQQTIELYKAGLHDIIRRDLLIVRLVNDEEAYQLTLCIEQQQ